MASSTSTPTKLDKINEMFRLKKFNKITERIEFIKMLLDGTELEPMIQFHNNDTECAENINKNITKVMPKETKGFKDVINQIGGKLLYIKSGTTGHTFKGISYPDKDKADICINYAVKIVAYPKKENYGSIMDVTRPENAELMMLKVLSYFVVNNQTPHIVLPIGTFNANIKTFVNLTKNNIVDSKKYEQFVKRYEDDEFHSMVSVLISEWADGGDLLDYLRANFTKLTVKEWRVIFFQILSVLAVIQAKYPSFRHNDMKANNILLQKIPMSTEQNAVYKYSINNTEYFVPNIGVQIKLWDFDFACIPGLIDNAKVYADWTNKINVSPEPHPYYDVHYFFNTLTSKNFLPNFWGMDNMGKPMVPKEVTEFIKRIVPDRLRTGNYVTERGRLLMNYADIQKFSDLKYHKPDDIIKYDPFFKKMRPQSTEKS
jgi:serine/threonine protein kinase